jgi:hypothetical protein
MKKNILNILLILALVLSLASTVFAQEGVDVPPPSGHKLSRLLFPWQVKRSAR